MLLLLTSLRSGGIKTEKEKTKREYTGPIEPYKVKMIEEFSDEIKLLPHDKKMYISGYVAGVLNMMQKNEGEQNHEKANQ